MGPSQDSVPATARPAAPSPPNDAQRRFADFVEGSQERVYRRIRKSIADQHTAEDLTQKTFVNAWTRWNHLDPSKDPLPWVLTIAQNVVTDHLRSDGAKKRRRPLRLGHDPLDGGQIQPVSELVTAEASKVLHFAIARLDEPDQELVTLHLAGLNYAEIAKKTGRSQSAVGPALTRIRHKLKEMLADYAA